MQVLRRLTTRRWHPLCRQITSKTVNEHEVAKFNNSDWWGGSNSNVAPLHAMQPVRLDVILQHIRNTLPLSSNNPQLPLEGLSVLDVGCGGGLFTEDMARLGATVTAVDASASNIDAAERHLEDSLRDRVTYRHATADDLLAEPQRFDVVCSLEVLEHVDEQDHFLHNCCQLVNKDQGVLAISTMNRTFKSLGLAIIAAEYITRMVPPGTHDWTKFVSPQHVQDEIHKHDMHTNDVVGMIYLPGINKWITSRMELDVNYIVLASR